MNKIKEWIKSKKKDIVYLLFILNIVIWATTYVTTKNFYEYLEDLEVRAMQASASELTREDKVIEKELSMKDWVLNEVSKAGLSKEEALIIIQCESKWNENAYNVNNNGTIDAGIWQINSIHKDITLKDKLDYKKATKWAIQKRLHDGNYSAWVCSKML